MSCIAVFLVELVAIMSDVLLRRSRLCERDALSAIHLVKGSVTVALLSCQQLYVALAEPGMCVRVPGAMQHSCTVMWQLETEARA